MRHAVRITLFLILLMMTVPLAVLALALLVLGLFPDLLSGVTAQAASVLAFVH